MVGSGKTRRSLLILNARISSSTWSGEGTVRLACTPHILAGTNLEGGGGGGVISPTRRKPGAYNWRLIVFAKGYAGSDEEEPLQIPTLLLRTREMLATGPSPRLLPVSLFRTTKTVTTSGEVAVRHTKV